MALKRFANVVFTVAMVLLLLVPSVQAQHDPAGAHTLTVFVGDVIVDGGFPELADDTEALIAPFRQRRATVDELQALAEVLELLYQQAGYVLARVTIPPQEVNDGDPFRLLVVDGYFEGIDMEGVPARVRPRVNTLLGSVVHERRLRGDELEHALTMARQTPGLSIRTTMVPGDDVGGARLVVEGDWTPFTGSLYFRTHVTDLTMPAPPWNGTLQMALNQPFGQGEQLTAHVSSPFALSWPPSWPLWNPDELSFGAGVKWPVGMAGESVHVNYSASRTYTPTMHIFIPATLQKFRKVSLEFSRPLEVNGHDAKRRMSVAVDATDESMQVPDFQFTLHEDGVRALRLGIDGNHNLVNGSSLSWHVQLSQGLTWRARTEKDVQASGIPFSRPGAVPAFRKLTGTTSWRLPFASRFVLTSTLRGQYAWAGPLPTSELFSVGGTKALPSVAHGVGPGDHGFTLREQVDTHFSFFDNELQLTAYGYVAAGATSGFVADAATFAVAAGLGVRGEAGPWRMSLEYARGRSRLSSGEAVVATVEVVF